jgi:hypothetical protein
MAQKRTVGNDPEIRRVAREAASEGDYEPERFQTKAADERIPAETTGTLHGERPYSPLPDVDPWTGETVESPLERAVTLMSGDAEEARTRTWDRKFTRGFGRVGAKRPVPQRKGGRKSELCTWTREQLDHLIWRLENPTTCKTCGGRDKPLYAKGMDRKCYDRARGRRKRSK